MTHNSKPVVLYVQRIDANPTADLEERISNIDIEISKPQASELLQILQDRIEHGVGGIRIRFTGRLHH